jgi:phosphohistidine phosphatase
MNTRQLILIRHAKSSWQDPLLADQDRPLSSRGVDDAKLMARQHYRMLAQLQHFYCSTALRAKETFNLMQQSLCLDSTPISYHQSLYVFNADAVLNFCQQLPANVLRAAVIGHNPALTELINQLCEKQISNLPTAGIAQLNVNGLSWQDLDKGATLTVFSRPKDHR